MTWTKPPQPSIEFFDSVSGRKMRYVYPDSEHWTAGWILYRHNDGQWATLRKAEPGDVERLTAAIGRAHHA